jgi:hypothetical protein
MSAAADIVAFWVEQLKWWRRRESNPILLVF